MIGLGCIIVTGLILPHAFSQSIKPLAESNETGPLSNNGTQFDLKINETYSQKSGNFKIKLLNVTSDSRCPNTAYCIWQGQVAVLVGITLDNKNLGNFSLSTLVGHDQIVFGRYALLLVQVSPPALIGKEISASDYVITFQISNAASMGSITIVNPLVQPPTIKVGDTFTINATIVNNSPNTITVKNGCGGPFSVLLDSHAKVELKKVCNWMAIQIILKPGENFTGSSIASNLGYRSISQGTANATVTFSYVVYNQNSDLGLDDNSTSVSRSFLYTISNQSIKTIPSISSPLAQFKSGIAAKDVTCKQGFQLIFKAEDGSPACVKPDTVQKLVARNWGTLTYTINNVIQENQNYTSNNFAFTFFSKILGQDKGNVFFSPYSISSLFSMVYEGARGKTADQIQSVFHFISDDAMRKSNAKAENTNLSSSPLYKLDLANAIWVQDDYHIIPSYIDILQQYYNSNVTNLDFKTNPDDSRKTINIWVENKTNQKIQDLLPEGSVNQNTRVVLTNAIYFKGNWTNQFLATDTQNENFTTSDKNVVTVSMMSTFASFPYYEDDKLQILQMPYQGDRLSMIVLLPKDSNIQSLDDTLSPEQMHKWSLELVSTPVKVYMPKFSLDTKYILNDKLGSMGIRDAFDPNAADFTSITGNKDLSVSMAVHQAYLRVDERGTEAAAATGIIFQTTSMPIYKDVFRADHPFVFMIYDKQTDLILFLGQVTDPTK